MTDDAIVVQGSAAWRNLATARGLLVINPHQETQAAMWSAFRAGTQIGGSDGPFILQVDVMTHTLGLRFEVPLSALGQALAYFDAVLREHLPTATVRRLSLEATEERDG